MSEAPDLREQEDCPSPKACDQSCDQHEKERRHWHGILSGQITRACLDNGMSEPDAVETAAVVLVKVIEQHGWQVIPPGGGSDD